jgi:hypothetical protein
MARSENNLLVRLHKWAIRQDENFVTEDTHFFARSKASQMQFLEQFLRENYELAKKITRKETSENPLPEEPEENEDGTLDKLAIPDPEVSP